MSEDRPTDPSELRAPTVPPSLPTGVVAVPSEVLEFMLSELKGIRSEVHQSKVDILAQLADLTLEVIPRVQKLESQAVTGFGICRYHHSNGGSRESEPHL